MAGQAVLAVHDISKRYGTQDAVSGLSFEVRAGEIFGFLGPNGAGKTTTLRMLMGILAPDSGDVRYEGQSRLDRSRIGYLPEERGLFEDAPVLDTLTYLGELRGMRRADARAAARPWLERMDLAARAGEKVNTLSKGNQQKVQLIGAILHRPALAVLDEPFSGLDPVNQEVLMEVLRELCAAGTAVLLSAHHLDLVERLADRFLLISRGREVMSGTLEELRQRGAGGNDEIVRLGLAARVGGVLDTGALTEVVRSVVPGAGVELADGTDGEWDVDVLLPPGTDLGPLLAALGERAAIRRVESRRMPLHEIYLRAVRGAGGDIPGPEVDAHG